MKIVAFLVIMKIAALDEIYYLCSKNNATICCVPVKVVHV